MNNPNLFRHGQRQMKRTITEVRRSMQGTAAAPGSMAANAAPTSYPVTQDEATGENLHEFFTEIDSTESTSALTS